MQRNAPADGMTKKASDLMRTPSNRSSPNVSWMPHRTGRLLVKSCPAKRFPPSIFIFTRRNTAVAAPEKKNETFIGKFILAALAQKSMVTNRIFKSGSKLAGYSADFNKKGFRGIMDYEQLVRYQGGDDKK